MPNGKKNGKNGNGRRPRQRRGNNNGPSRTPAKCLTRTFRYTTNVQLNNSSGVGISQYAYYSKFLDFQPQNSLGFRDCQQTFELWRLRRARIKVQPSYNAYNQTYNTINQDAIAALQIWSVSDLSRNETVSGESIMSYNNARVHTVSLNGIKTIVDTAARLNIPTGPTAILGADTWLDTSTDLDTSGCMYNGAQIFARMPQVAATNYLPNFQLIFEFDCEFKQPAYQNRPSSFSQDIVGATLVTRPNAGDLDELRVYKIVSYTLNDSGNKYRLLREDGVPGSLDYTEDEFYRVFINNTSGSYFGDRKTDYTGPIPSKPLGFVL